MARIEKTVFISYRRTDVFIALAVYENLKNQGYDVFFDYTSISSGDFEQIIIGNIKARAHFLVILTPTALDRCSEQGDWLRREIETAIDEKRNIVPLFFKGFQFGNPSVSEKLTGKLKNLNRYNGLNVHEDYFDEAIRRLRTQYLSIPLHTVLHPVSTEVQKVVRKEQVAADRALEQIEDVKELVKQAEKTPAQKEKLSEPVAVLTGKSNNTRAIPWRIIASLVGGSLIIVFGVWGGIKVWNDLPRSTPNTQPVRTNTSAPTYIFTPIPPTGTSIPPTPTLGVGSTMVSPKDGMTLLYVPAGKFTMGSTDSVAEKPVHTVTLDAFWIDQTEVTNAMYAKCVLADECDQPSSVSSYTRQDYFGNSEFDNYPVIYVSWEDAKTYCLWADRRLPTEAEWEKAARGENALIYPWGNDAPNNYLLNYNSNVRDTTEVRKYPNGASPYGVLDMAGNVWEWVADWYDETYYDSSPTSNPLGPNSGTWRVLRGGSWYDYRSYVRSANRGIPVPTDTSNYIGFRCSRSP